MSIGKRSVSPFCTYANEDELKDETVNNNNHLPKSINFISFAFLLDVTFTDIMSICYCFNLTLNFVYHRKIPMFYFRDKVADSDPNGKRTRDINT